MKRMLLTHTSVRRSLAAVVVLMLVLVAGARAQGTTNDEIESIAGTVYVIAFPDTTKNTYDARYPNTQYEDKAILFIYSAVDNRFEIKGRGFNIIQTVAGGKFTVVDLSGATARAPSPIVIDHCKPVDNTFRIVADQPIVVYQYLVTKFGTEAWTPLPISAWGTEYYAAAHPGEVGSDVSPGGEFDYNRKNKMFPAEILVIAAYDDTRIEIEANGAVHTGCDTSVVTLKAGEAYQIQSYVDTLTANAGTAQPDFGGSRITANKPIGVISGNTRAQLIDENVGLGKNTFKNMLIEWLAPVELYGKEFVYMPTWDSHRPTGAPGEDPSTKRKAELVRVYASAEEDTTGITYTDSLGATKRAPKIDAAGGVEQLRYNATVASAITTSQPAQVMMSSVAIVKYAGTTQGFGGYIGAAYDGWGGYTVNLTPRHRWTSFAPFYASTHPAGMSAYLNVVTDSSQKNDIYLKDGSNFIFQRAIRGTSLVWGSMAVQPGVDHWLEGRNGATFGGFVYGGMTRGGHEEYRPGRTRERELDPPTHANTGDGDDQQVLHPSEYEEYLAIAFGYPLVASNNIPEPGDSLRITKTSDCAGTTYMIAAVNLAPVGLRSVRLDNAVNARIVSQPWPLTGLTSATVVVAPINATVDASATLVIVDRSGKITREPFAYFVERATFVPGNAVFDFGGVKAGMSKEASIEMLNPMGRALIVRNMRWASGGGSFALTSPTTFPQTVASGGTIDLSVRVTAARPDQLYVDTLFIELECTRLTIVVKIESDPCLNIADLDFGTIRPGESRRLPLRICNEGVDTVSFANATGGSVIEWLGSDFAVSAEDMALLQGEVLDSGECITIWVTFTAPSGTEGTYRDTATIWSSSVGCRSVSRWLAAVSTTVAAPEESSASNTLSIAEPNPFSNTTTVRFTLARASHAVLVLYDEQGRHVATLVDDALAAGAHTVEIDGSRLPAGAYHYRLTAGEWSATRSVVRR